MCGNLLVKRCCKIKTPKINTSCTWLRFSLLFLVIYSPGGSLGMIFAGILGDSNKNTLRPITQYLKDVRLTLVVAIARCCRTTTLIARFMGPTWGPSEADRTQVGPMMAPWTLLSGKPLPNQCEIRTMFNDTICHSNPPWLFILWLVEYFIIS